MYGNRETTKCVQNGRESLYVNVWNFSHCGKITSVGRKKKTAIKSLKWKTVETSNREMLVNGNETEHPDFINDET